MTTDTKLRDLNAASLYYDHIQTDTPSVRNTLLKSDMVKPDVKKPSIFRRWWSLSASKSSENNSTMMRAFRIEEDPVAEDDELVDSGKKFGCVPTASRYVPSPLLSPRRIRQRLSDRIGSSPVLSRVRKRFTDPRIDLAAARETPALHDVGRIANRYSSTRWDAW